MSDIPNLGLGVMIHMLSGSDETTQKSVRFAIGKIIRHAELKDKRVLLDFDEGTLSIWDNGQSCCLR